VNVTQVKDSHPHFFHRETDRVQQGTVNGSPRWNGQIGRIQQTNGFASKDFRTFLFAGVISLIDLGG